MKLTPIDLQKGFAKNEEHCTLNYILLMTAKEATLTSVQLEQFIYDNIRVISSKTGKSIKLVLYKRTKQELSHLLNNYIDFCSKELVKSGA